MHDRRRTGQTCQPASQVDHPPCGGNAKLISSNDGSGFTYRGRFSEDWQGKLLKTDDRVLRQQMQRLVSCRVDRARLPADIKRALVRRASTPLAYSPAVREKLLFTACAVLKKYHYDQSKEVWSIEPAPNKHDRSYRFGRLLAVLEKVERAYFPRLRPGIRAFYKNAISQIMEEIHRFPDSQWNQPLADTYLMGYYLQRGALHRSRKHHHAEDEEHTYMEG